MKRAAPIGLAASILGWTVSPLFYVALGTPFQLPIAMALMLVGTTLVASTFLLVRCLARPAAHHAGLARRIAEGVSAAIVLAFLVLMANTVFVGNSRRLGFAFTVFFGAWLFCLPLVLVRKTDLEQRLAKIPRGVSIGALALLLSVSGFYVYLFLSRPGHLI